eukprot:4600176-Lingulodinium_polyedra.AAC.1
MMLQKDPWYDPIHLATTSLTGHFAGLVWEHKLELGRLMQAVRHFLVAARSRQPTWATARGPIAATYLTLRR